MTSEEANLADVKANIAAAAAKARPDRDSVTLVAVTKTIPAERIQRIVDAGVHDLGENRVQELTEKISLVEGPVRWHLIGTLQTNKVKYIINHVYMIHSLDRLSLAEEIDRRAREAKLVCRVLVQVNVSGEESKHGISPSEVISFVREAAALPGLRICGLMTMAPQTAEAEEARPVFRGLRELAAKVEREKITGVTMEVLSMGMSNDYQVAVEEGATMVRVGSGIFGPRG